MLFLGYDSWDCGIALKRVFLFIMSDVHLTEIKKALAI